MTAGENGVRAGEYPCALFLGDYNTGKSAIINALLRRNALFSARRESCSVPAFIAATNQADATYAALSADGALISAKTHEEFMNLRRERGVPASYGAAAARLPGLPFARLVLVDTPGSSTDAGEQFDLSGVAARGRVLAVVVADIEYWSAKHTLERIAQHFDTFSGRVLVAANKADHLNIAEIRKVCDKAARRMEDFGIRPAPRFLALSARLEAARADHGNEYRQRTKQEVREHCDAAFDALRVALYEFEAEHAGSGFASFESILNAPFAASFIALHQGNRHELC